MRACPCWTILRRPFCPDSPSSPGLLASWLFGHPTLLYGTLLCRPRPLSNSCTPLERRQHSKQARLLSQQGPSLVLPAIGKPPTTRAALLARLGLLECEKKFRSCPRRS